MKKVVCLLICALAVTARADAANRTVCRTGCQYTDLQTAINDAVPGDVILLRAGETFTGNFLLKAKTSSATDYITIRSDASDASFPASGVRLIPEGKSGANVLRSQLPRLVGQGGGYKSTPVIRTSPGAHHYRLQFLEIDGTGNLGYETLVQLGENTSNQTSLSSSPHHFEIDRVYLHGHATKGMKRGVALDCRDAVIRDSYISDIKSLADAQAIAVFNGAGPFTILNNYLEASGENILFGGADPKIPNLVPSNITIRQNHLYKPLAWRTAALPAPSRVTTSVGSSGSLPADTHYFKVVAVTGTGGATLYSGPSTEVAVTTGAQGSVAISWAAVSGADNYRVYRGSSSNGQNVYTSVTGTSLTYTGASESSGAPNSAGRWVAKNLMEFKNGQSALIDGNVFENNWDGFQQGYAIVLTPRNQENTAPWSSVNSITFTNNLVLNVASAMNVLGADDIHPSERFHDLVVRNNLFDIETAMGGNGHFVTITGAPTTLTFDHNTILHSGKVINVGGPAVPGLVFTNNLARHNAYGVQGTNYGIGLSSLNHYFPGFVFTGNVLAGGSASLYPAGNFFPSTSAFNAAFRDPAAGDYTILPGTSLGGAPLTIGVSMSTLAAASGGQIVVDPPATEPPPTDDGGGSNTPLPDGWDTTDVGPVGRPGAAGFDGGTFALSGGGVDIWNSSDEFRFAYRTMSGNGTIVARVSALSGTDNWTKAGVMIRATTAAGSAHATMFVSKAKGLSFQRRRSTGATSVSTAGGAGTAPSWVRLDRAGSVITASVSANGTTWTTVGSDTISLGADVLVGLALTNHDDGGLATAQFDQVAVTGGGGDLPDGWSSRDVGQTGRTGSTTSSAGVYTLRGAGADVWGTKDALQFAYTSLDGDGDVIARVASVSGAQAWTKVGVMMRNALDAGAPQAFMLVSTGKGAAFQRRTVAGGLSDSTPGGAVTAPRWVKLSRRGSTITASISSNGTSWTTVGRDSFSIGDSLLVGLAVSSHDATTLATGTFDNVRVVSVP